MPDPNWLLSSAAQSAAAIVGLMAAFLLHRLMSLGAERASLERRIVDVDTEVEQKQAQIGNLQERIRGLDADAFMQEHANQIIESRGEVDLRDLIASGGTISRTAGELTPDFRRVTGIVKRAFNVLEPRIEDYGFDPPASFGDFAREAQLPLPKGEELRWYEAAYGRLRDEYSSVARPGRRRRAKPVELPAGEYPTQGRQALTEERDSAQTALHTLLGEKERTKAVLQGLERPPGVRTAVLALIYFAISGVALPMILMPAEADAFQPTVSWAVAGINLSGDRLRGLVIAAFLSGLVFVLIYLIWAVRLAAPRKRKNLPVREFDPRSLSRDVQ
jgi:hypothetical protein